MRTALVLTALQFLVGAAFLSPGTDKRRLLIKLRPRAAADEDEATREVVVCDTTTGTFELELRPEWSPLGGESSLYRSPYPSNSICHSKALP
jgi:hypothetical protein